MPSRLSALVQHSIDLIVDTQSPTGAWVASPTFPTYQYCWFRDGAFIADAVSRHGQVEVADNFHRWCLAVLEARRDHITDLVARGRRDDPIAPDEHLRTRYTVDGADDHQPWENFQLDGYGTWLWALRQHRDRHHGETLPDDADVVGALVAYLATFWDLPSYDWWEEHLDQRHTSTLVAIWAGLDAVAGWAVFDDDLRAVAATTADDIATRVRHAGVDNGHLVKWLGGNQVDASLVAAVVPFAFLDVDAPVAVATVARVEADLVDGGVHRYLGDVYYGGGQWILLAGFLGWYHAKAGNIDRARELLAWMADQTDDELGLPEQVAHRMLHPSHLPAWEERWGPSADPLLWSHAMLLDLVAELGCDDAADPT